MPLNKPSCRFSICNHLFQFLRGHSKSRPPGEFPYEPFKTLNHSHISYHGSPASVFSLWWCNSFARSAGNFFCRILQIFGGLVLGCIKLKFCKKIICVRQHFSGKCCQTHILIYYFLATIRFDTDENEPTNFLLLQN